MSPGALAFDQVPPAVRQGLGRYPVPVFRLARIAVALNAQRQGLGAELLLAAGARASLVAESVGGVALAIDAKDEAAAVWYARFGAVPLLDEPLRLVLPLATLRQSLTGGQA